MADPIEMLTQMVRDLSNDLRQHNQQLSEHMRQSDRARGTLKSGIEDIDRRVDQTRKDLCALTTEVKRMKPALDTWRRTRNGIVWLGGIIITGAGIALVGAWKKVLAAFGI